MDEFEECNDAEDIYGPCNLRKQTRTAGLRVHGKTVEMVAKVDHIIAAVRSMETMHTAHAERRGRNQPSRWRKRTGAAYPDDDPLDSGDFDEPEE